MPSHVIFNIAVSLDGKTGKEGKQIEFLSRMDKYRVHQLRGNSDAIMIDVDLIKKENPEITVRKEVEEPYRVIVDAKAETPLDAKILGGAGKVIVVVSRQAPRLRIDKLGEVENVETMVIGDYAINLPRLLSNLYETNKIETIFLERGGNLPGRMFKESLVNELYISIMPAIIGKDGNPIDIFDITPEKDIELELEGIIQYGEQVVLHYLIK